VTTEHVQSWLTKPETGFPLDAVVEEFHLVGKHFVDDDLLKCLDAARDVLRGDGYGGDDQLAAFLDQALDKYDGRYDYPSYIGLNLLGLPGTDAVLTGAGLHRGRYLELLGLLLGDVIGFEIAASGGAHDWLPMLRPPHRTVSKRCHIALRLFREIGDELAQRYTAGGDPVGLAHLVSAAAVARAPGRDRRAIALAMLPVYRIHDEYMFIRTLQMFELSFNMLAGELRRAIDALSRSEVGPAVAAIASGTATLRTVSPLFSFLATMDVESFRTFRSFTEGASAIQSHNYKLVEALCRMPDETRLASSAYTSVPTVRHAVLSGIPTISAATSRYLETAPEGDAEPLRQAMTEFSAAMRQWRNTHYRLARRMLGDVRGTGYTEGVPYLRDVVDIPVFTTRPTIARPTTGGSQTKTSSRSDSVHSGWAATVAGPVAPTASQTSASRQGSTRDTT
jgi:tryptophan 2,3-dioxygenase